MKNLSDSLLALCLLHHGTAAFTVAGPKNQAFTALKARAPLFPGDFGFGEMPIGTQPRTMEREVGRVDRIREMDEQIMDREGDLVVIGRNMGGQMARMNAILSARRRLPHDVSNARVIHGGSRETWSATGNRRHEKMEVLIDSEGRPVDAEFELYQGPNNVRQRIKIYSENGSRHPFGALVDIQPGVTHSVSVRNTGSMAYPLTSSVHARHSDGDGILRDTTMAPSETIQGGSLKTFPFVGNGPQTVQVSLKSEGMPVIAVVELWKGPNNVKQVAEVYADDGSRNPVNLLIDTGGGESTIAVYNTGSMTFPLEASVESVDF